MMYKSQFRKMDPYDWFCAPGSHIVYLLVNDHLCVILLFEMLESYEEDVVQADRLSDSAEVWVIIYYLISRQFYFSSGSSLEVFQTLKWSFWSVWQDEEQSVDETVLYEDTVSE